jgi:hypothetical protein
VSESGHHAAQCGSADGERRVRPPSVGGEARTKTSAAGRVTSVLAAVACTLAGCGGGSPPQYPNPGGAMMAAPLVHIIFSGVLVGPTKSNGCQWDGPTCNAGGAAGAVGAVKNAFLSSSPAAAVALTVAGPMMASLEKPDPEGTATLYAHGLFTPIGLPKRQDSFTPTWDARWTNVVLDETVRVHVVLDDADVVNNDDMGAFDLSFNDLMRALQTGGALSVRVSEPTFNQVLFAEVSVIAAR